MLGRRFEGGVDLSGGEWQKLALARAYMRDAQLIILDEPTASLDARSEYEVFQSFAELTDSKMALLISHRFSTVRMSDRILVLEKGRIAEQGNHRQLWLSEGSIRECLNYKLLATDRSDTIHPENEQLSRFISSIGSSVLKSSQLLAPSLQQIIGETLSTSPAHGTAGLWSRAFDEVENGKIAQRRRGLPFSSTSGSGRSNPFRTFFVSWMDCLLKVLNFRANRMCL